MDEALKEQFSTDNQLKLALYLMKKLYQFNDAFQELNTDEMRAIYEKVRKRRKKSMKQSHERLMLKYLEKSMLRMYYEVRYPNVPWSWIVGETPEDQYKFYCKMFESFTLAGLMLEGMPLEDAKISAGLGLRPTFKAVSPF